MSDHQRITYPKSLKEIPLRRQRRLAEDILWFSRYSPTERLNHVDREWAEIQAFIEKFGMKRDGTGTGS